MDLNYTPKDVKEMERTVGQSIDEIVTTPTMANLSLLLRKGLNLNVDQTDELLGDKLKELGKDELMFAIMEVLQEQGFLSAMITPQNVREQMKKYAQKINDL